MGEEGRSEVRSSIIERCFRIGFVVGGDDDSMGRSRAAAVLGEGLGLGVGAG
jgi:hypothetical protein